MAELRTRIQLKYDSYERWLANKALIPLKGEVCIVNPSTGSDYNLDGNKTSCLMKVGDGVTSFENLPWLSALAADVHSWAKYDAAKFTRWVTNTPAEGESFADSPKLATAAQVAALSNTVASHTTAIEALQTIVGSAAEGETPATGLLGSLERLEADLNTVEELVGLGGSGDGQSITDRVASLERTQETQGTTLTNLDSVVTGNTNNIATLMGDDTTEGSIANLIKIEADRAKGAEAGLQANIEAEATARDTAITNATSPLITRIVAVETTSTTNAETLADLVPDSADAGKSIRDIAADEINTLIGGANSADTIQDIESLINYVNTHGSSTAALVGQVETNTTNIGTLTTTVGGHTTRISAVENSVAALEETLGTVTEGKTITDMIDAAVVTANNYVDEQVETVLETIDAVSKTVEGHTTAIAANTTAIGAEETRAKEAEKTLLENITAEADRARGVEATLTSGISQNANDIAAIQSKALTFIHSEVEGSDEVQLAEGGVAIECLVFNCGDSDLNN